MILIGRIIECDNCGERVFEKKISEKEMDGGYTTIPYYERTPASEAFDKVYIHNRNLDLCPNCMSNYNKMLLDNFPDLLTKCREAEDNETS